ncbi:MAG: TetR/AcrR family transcriptional regulator [Acidobacteria bacterium]|nr:TetR/AcrR family transcriptional regulator [Acidobacteriota bacterium]
MKRQKQIDESKDMIVSAFVRLLEKNDYDTLTLSEIAAEAGVNRMTIYRHFKSKEKIVLYRAIQNMEKLESEISDEHKPYMKLIYKRLEWIQSLPHLQVLLRSREIEELLDSFMMDAHKNALAKALGFSFSDNPPVFQFYFGGVNRVVREWLRDGCKESFQEIADRIIMLTLSFIRVHKKS